MGFPSTAIVSVLSSFEQETNKTNAMITNAILFSFYSFFETLILKTATRSVAVLPNPYYKCSCSSNYICFNTKVTAFVLLCNVIVDVVKLATFHVLFNKLKELLPVKFNFRKHLALNLPHKYPLQ
jgi:hypothetical protein